MASQKAREIADRVEEAIRYNRDSVPGKDSNNPHLYNSDRIEDSEKITVKFWSDQGFFHDCWINAKVFRNGTISFNHCGCDGIRKLARLVRSEV